MNKIFARACLFVFIVALGGGSFCCRGVSDEAKGSTATSLPSGIDLLVRSIEEYSGSDIVATAGNVLLEIRVSLVNTTANDIELFFDSSEHQSAGGFRVFIGSRPYWLRAKLTGSREYTSTMPAEHLISSHGVKDYDLLAELPEKDANNVIAKPEEARVDLLVYGFHFKGKRMDIFAGNSITGRWSPVGGNNSTQPESQPASQPATQSTTHPKTENGGGEKK